MNVVETETSIGIATTSAGRRNVTVLVGDALTSVSISCCALLCCFQTHWAPFYSRTSGRGENSRNTPLESNECKNIVP